MKMILIATLYLSVFGIVFTYAGYPLLLSVLARLRSRPVQRREIHAEATLIIVTFNEQKRIADKIHSCLEQSLAGSRLRIMVVSDGSTDDTDRIVEAFREQDVVLLSFPERRGKSACLNDAVAACNDELIVFCDVRQPLDSNAVRFLLENFADPAIGAVGGELMFRSDALEGFSGGIDAYWRYEKFIREKESAIDSVVGLSGALYAMRRSLWQPIPPDTILDDVLIPMNVVMQGQRVVFDKRAIAWDRPSTSSVQERVRKVRTLGGNFQLIGLRPELLLPWRNRLFVQFFCHKLLRLLVPLLMTIALVSNTLLARYSSYWVFLLGLQLLAYAIGIAGMLSPRLNNWLPIKMLTTFLTLNSFVVLGFVDFLFNKNAHLWRSHSTSR